MRKRRKKPSEQTGVGRAAARVRGPPEFPSAADPGHGPLHPHEEGLSNKKRETSSKLKCEFFPQLPRYRAQIFRFPWHLVRARIPTSARGSGTPGSGSERSAKVFSPSGRRPRPQPEAGGAPRGGWRRGGSGPRARPHSSGRPRRRSPPEPGWPGVESTKAGDRAAAGGKAAGPAGGRRDGWRRGARARQTHPCPPARPPQQKTPDPPPPFRPRAASEGAAPPGLHYLIAKG